MHIVRHDKDGLPRLLASVVRVDLSKKEVTFRFPDVSVVEMISDLPFGSLHFVMTPVPAIRRRETVQESRISEPQAEEGYLDKARRLVFNFVSTMFDKSDPEVKFTMGDVYVVWFCKTLQNWKALVSTSLPDQKYYEVTYNGDKKETYVDVYLKVNNICFPDVDRVRSAEETARFNRESQEPLPRRSSGEFSGLNPAGSDRFA